MKKIYMSVAGVILAASVGAAGVFAAGGSSITVRSDRSEVSYTYKAGDGNEAKADASKLFDGFRGVGTDEYKTENLTITSKTQNGSNIEIALVIETENTVEEYSPLDYYSFVVTADNGDVIYDDASEEPSDVSASSKEIPFGRFNTQFTTDTKTYAVEYKINSEIAGKVDEETLSGLSVSIVSRIVPAEKDEAAPTKEQTGAVAERDEDPTYTVSVEAEEPEEVVSAAASPAAAAEEYEIDGKDTTANEVKKVCGKDIPAGRYLVSGNGVVVIESAAGELKGETTLTDGTIPGVEGVDAAIATITEGDVITARPLPGQEKPAIKFEKANTSPQATATSAASAASASSNRGSAAKATAAPAKKTAAAKSNPKTGEDSPEIIWLCTMMAAAAAVIGILEIIKRKKVK